jgi:hypothetical protein
MISLRILGTPVRIQPAVLLIVVALWAGTAAAWFFLRPGLGTVPAALLGFATMVLLLLADFGHPLGHILSARLAGAPMDEIRITATEMPHTLYNNNAVSPAVHRIRALGGPVFNLLGLLLSAGVYAAAPDSVAGGLAAWSAAGHGMMLIMSLAPVPAVDGGTLLKWTLVAGGRSEAAAEAAALRAGRLTGAAAAALGLGLLLALHAWIIGVLLVLAGLIVLGVAAGLIR